MGASVMPFSDSDSSSPGVLQERGSLRTLRDGQSQFIGSSTGVYFVNTVRRAFSDANELLQDAYHPSPEDCIVAEDEDESPGNAAPLRSASSLSPISYGPNMPSELGQPPPAEIAGKLFMRYFQTWHRFFPFLHGPTQLQDIELLYSNVHEQPPGQPAGTQPLSLAKVIILQCLFNLTDIRSDELPVASQIVKPGDLLGYLPGLAVHSDIVSIQALFAAQLLLVARMSLRSAAAVGGLLSRSIFLAGLHRCPARYRELSAEDCDIRKRIFWSIYVVDRYLSQSLGHPLGIQDSDVDVCSLVGPEHHHHNPPKTLDASSSSRKFDRHLVLSLHVDYSRLLGRALELFHKSIHVRSLDPDSILSLRTDVNAWWNALPSHLQDSSLSQDASSPGKAKDFSESAFFILLHCQLVLLINRPWLSLEPSSAKFRSALQTCIAAAREIIMTLKKQNRAGNALFWPGYLSATWMAGTIVAFACHLELYPAEKGHGESMLCLEILSGMSNHWSLARNCHTVLSGLQRAFETPNRVAAQETLPEESNAFISRAGSHPHQSSREGHPNSEQPSDRTETAAKRRRLDDAASFIQPEARVSTYQVRSADQHAVRREQLADQSTISAITIQGDAVSSTPAMWSPARGTQPAFQAGGQFKMAPVPGGYQHPGTDSPFATIESPGGLGGHGPGQSSTCDCPGDARWGAGPDILSNWDSGMPDILAGATWESLLNVINQDNLMWDDAFH